MNNKLIIASAGSGKTTLIVKAVLQTSNNVLITTYTEANEAEIKRKIIELNKFIPDNVTVQTWFSFLLQHGVKPYQGTMFDPLIKGLLLTNTRSGLKYPNSTVYYSEKDNLKEHYFTDSLKIYSDKLSKFVIRCNENSKGEVLKRLNKIYSQIYIDEVQDLAGYDLEILALLFKSSIELTLAGDPRQVTYLTHNEAKHSKYKNGLIKQFIEEKHNGLCLIDETTLKKSHRNNKEICDFASKLYPNLPASTPCECIDCRKDISSHNGIFLVAKNDVDEYEKLYRPVTLRYNNADENEWTFGKSKGLGFDRVILYPPSTMLNFLKDGKLTKQVKGETKDAFEIAKFYVAVTRARYSVAIVQNYGQETYIDGVLKWK